MFTSVSTWPKKLRFVALLRALAFVRPPDQQGLSRVSLNAPSRLPPRSAQSVGWEERPRYRRVYVATFRHYAVCAALPGRRVNAVISEHLVSQTFA